MKSLAPYQSTCSLAQCHLFCSRSYHPVIGKPCTSKILRWNRRMQRQAPHTHTASTLSALLCETAFLGSESFPSKANIQTNSHTFGPCRYISVRLSNRAFATCVQRAVFLWLCNALRGAFGAGSGTPGEVMKLVGVGFRAWSNPLLLLASLMCGMSPLVQAAVPVVSEGDQKGESSLLAAAVLPIQARATDPAIPLLRGFAFGHFINFSGEVEVSASCDASILSAAGMSARCHERLLSQRCMLPYLRFAICSTRFSSDTSSAMYLLFISRISIC